MVNEAARGYLVDKGWDEKYGARPLRRVLQREVEDPLALKVLEGAYRDGDVIMVSPAAPVRRGDRVVVKTKNGEVLVKELKRQTAKLVELKSLNPEHAERTLPINEVVWVARILWASQ